MSWVDAATLFAAGMALLGVWKLIDLVRALERYLERRQK